MSKSRISPHFLFSFLSLSNYLWRILKASHFSFQSRIHFDSRRQVGLRHRRQEDEGSPIVFTVAPQGAYFKMHHWPVSTVAVVLYGWGPMRWQYEWNEKRGEMEDTSVTMKDLWQALRAGGAFISLLSTKSPPLRCSTHLLCSVLSLFCILTHSLSRSMLSPAAITIHNLTSPTLPFTSALVFTRLPSFPSSSSSSLWLCVSCSVDPSCLSFSPAHSCFSALLLSPPHLSSPPLHPSCPPSHWSIFCLLCLRRLFSPYSLPVYLPAFRNPWGFLIKRQFSLPPSLILPPFRHVPLPF